MSSSHWRQRKRFFADSMTKNFLLAFWLIAAPGWAVDLAESIPARCREVVLVVAPDWSSTTGTLQRFVRTGAGTPWQPVGSRVPVLLGQHGMAWGVGLHSAPGNGAPQKIEGDLRSPAGVFALGPAFGRLPRQELPWVRLPYQQLTPTTEAIDDSRSRFYGRIVDRKSIADPDWHNSEQMWRAPAYELGVIIGHNPEHRPREGSCIFLHLWLGDRAGTAGCTALHPADLEELVRWLDPARHPVIIQLPAKAVRENLAGF